MIAHRHRLIDTPISVLFAAAVLVAIPILSCTRSSDSARGDDVEARLDAAAAEAKLFGFSRGYDLAHEIIPLTQSQSDQWQWAVFLSGVCAQQASPPTAAMIQRAGDLYRVLLEQTPDSRYAPRATMNLGRLAELIDTYGDRSDLDAARRWYSTVIERWSNQPIAGEATLRLAGTHLQTFEDEGVTRAITLLERWLEAHPHDPLAAGMWQYLGDAYCYPRADYVRSFECYERADAIGLLETGREGPVYWRMAVLADRFLKDRERAVTYYTRIIEKTPASGKAYEAQLALTRLGAPVPELPIFKYTRDAQAEGAP